MNPTNPAQSMNPIMYVYSLCAKGVGMAKMITIEVGLQ